MRKTNFILILSLLMSGCGQNDLTTNVETKNRGKRALSEEQVVVKKTPEEALREKLNNDESKGLNFLKEALGDESKLNQILSLDENKVKEALKHIQSEFEKCTGNNASQQKETFKQMIKAAGNLDNIKQAISVCELGVGG